MSEPTLREHTRAMARRRWSKPEAVDRRVDALARVIRDKIDALPPLTAEQRERLAALLRPGDGGGQ